MEAALKDNDALEKEALERQESSRRAFSQDRAGGLPTIVGQYSMEHVITTPVRIILHALMWRKVTLAPVTKDSLETPVNTPG